MGKQYVKEYKANLQMIKQGFIQEQLPQLAQSPYRQKITKNKQKRKSNKKMRIKTEDQDQIKETKCKKNQSTGQIWTIYKKFFAYSLKRWKWGLCCILITLFSAFFQSILPYKLGQLLDLLTTQASTDQSKGSAIDNNNFKNYLTEHMIILGSLTILIGIGTFVRYLVLQLFQQQLAMDMKCQIYNIFIQNDINFFEIHESNALVSRLSNDVNQAKSAISNNLTMLLKNLILCIASLCVLMSMSWKCTLIMLSIIPIYSYVTLVYKRKAKELVKKRQDVQASIAVHVGEKFAGISVIKSYNTEQKEMKKYKQLNQQVYNLNKKRTLYQGIHSTCSSFLPTLGSLFVLLYEGMRLLAGQPELTAGQLTSFILYCSSLASSTASLSNSYTNIVNGTSAIQRVFEMMSYQKLIQENMGHKVIIDGSINFENVDFSYPKTKQKIDAEQKSIKTKFQQTTNIDDQTKISDRMSVNCTQFSQTNDKDTLQPQISKNLGNCTLNNQVRLFKNINFKIKKGQYIGFVGQSGSGKSTIFKLIQHFYKVSSGKITFRGKKISNLQNIQKQDSFAFRDQSQQVIEQNLQYFDSDVLNIKYLRDQIGVVNQQATLFNGSIQQNIVYGVNDYSQQQLRYAAQKSGCLNFINNDKIFPQGFNTIVGQRGSKLSGGQKQRISIARALMTRPKILLFDEATSALDSHSEHIIKQTIEQLSNSEELTIIVIAHRLSTVIHCDRLYVMKQGQIVEEGSHKQLIKNKGYYYELIQKQLHEDGGRQLKQQLQIEQQQDNN